MDLNRRLIITASVAALVLLLLGFAIGRATGGGSGDTPTPDSATALSSTRTTGTTSQDNGSTTTTPGIITGDSATSLESTSAVDLGDALVYGTDAERETFVNDLVQAGVVGGSREGLLATADHVCYMLERLQAQNRTPAFAVRVVWNESLADLRSEDLAAFATVFNAAPRYLCQESIEYGESVAYWLGY
jgi:hypothetical protein